MSEEKDFGIIVIDNRLLSSVVRDAISFGWLIAMMSIGLIMDSSAFQWLSGILCFAWLVSRQNQFAKKSRMTLAEARAFLDRLENGSAGK